MTIGISTVSAATHNITDTNYGNNFNINDGTILSNSTIAAGDTLIVGNLYNKDFLLDRRLNVQSNGSDKIFNGTITLIPNADGSVLRSINIDNVAKDGIVLDNVSKIQVIRNNIKLTGTSSYFTITGINMIGSTNAITIEGNTIKIDGESPYAISNTIWGLDANLNYTIIIDQTLSDMRIVSNKISVNTTGIYSAGIYTSTISDYRIVDNGILVSSKQFIYGIVVNDESSSANLTTVRDVYIDTNKVTGIGKIATSKIDMKLKAGTMVYLIELYLTGNTQITKNELTGEGNGVYGVALYGSNYTTIQENDIDVTNGSASFINHTANYDAIDSEYASAAVMVYGQNTPQQIWNYYITITHNQFGVLLSGAIDIIAQFTVSPTIYGNILY